MSKSGHLLWSREVSFCGNSLIPEVNEFEVNKGMFVEGIVNTIGNPFSCHAINIGRLFSVLGLSDVMRFPYYRQTWCAQENQVKELGGFLAGSAFRHALEEKSLNWNLIACS